MSAFIFPRPNPWWFRAYLDAEYSKLLGGASLMRCLSSLEGWKCVISIFGIANCSLFREVIVGSVIETS